VLKTSANPADCTVRLPAAVVGPGHPGSNGISGDGTGSLVHRTRVPILFHSQKAFGSS
jgi:hypothetical protein